MVKNSVATKTVALDLSDREGTYVVVGEGGEVERAGKVATNVRALTKWAGSLERSRLVIEVGGQSPWISRVLKAAGHEVIVANPRQLGLIAHGGRKNDRRDAELLARVGRMDPTLLNPVEHREARTQEQLAIVQARAHLVKMRTATINHIRATVKAMGERLPTSSADAFAKRVEEALPEGLRAALGPLVEEVAGLTARIKAYDEAMERLAAEEYPETRLLRQVGGVGALTALTYVLTLEEGGRFRKSRQAGAYLGLVPRQYESGASHPQLRITRAGDRYLRTLLVQCAQYILGPFGKPSALREWGLKLAGEGNRARKKRAIVAVARKLAVLLHRLWMSGEVYDPWYHQEGPMST
jgi:transposase